MVETRGCHVYVGEGLIELTGIVDRVASPEIANDSHMLLEPGSSPSILAVPTRGEFAVVITPTPTSDDPPGPGQRS